MEIIVIVGEAPAKSLPVEYDPYLAGVDPDDVVYTTAPGDLEAIEGAIQIREKQGGGRVTLVGLGPERFEPTLRKYLALGADAAVHIRGDSPGETGIYDIALTLARAVRSMKYDLILCGDSWADRFGSAVYLAPYLAEMLEVPGISGVTRVELPSADEVLVHQKMERGDRRILRCPLPCLLGLEQGTNEPRYAAFPDALLSLTREIQFLDAGSLAHDEMDKSGPPVEFAGYSPPRLRVKKGLVVDTGLLAAERMKLVRSGGLIVKDNRRLLEGEPAKLAGEIVSILVNRGIVKEKGNKGGRG